MRRLGILLILAALAGLLAAGRWLQPRLDREPPAASSTRPTLTSPPPPTPPWRASRARPALPISSSNVDPGEPGGDIVVNKDAVWVSNPVTATVRRIDPRRNQVTDDLWEADGSDLTVAADGVVWATSDTWLWLGTPRGLFHVNQSVLRQD